MSDDAKNSLLINEFIYDAVSYTSCTFIPVYGLGWLGHKKGDAIGMVIGGIAGAAIAAILDYYIVWAQSPFHDDREADFQPLYDSLYGITPITTTTIGYIVGDFLDIKYKFGEVLISTDKPKSFCKTFHPFRIALSFSGATIGTLIDVFLIRNNNPANDKEDVNQKLAGKLEINDTQILDIYNTE